MALFRKKKKVEIEEPPAYKPLAKLEEMKDLDLGLSGVGSDKTAVGIEKQSLTKEISGGKIEDLHSGKLANIPTSIPNQLEMPSHEPDVVKGPLFIKIDKYKVALESVESINKKLGDITRALDKLKELKNKETVEIDKWENEVEDMKRKLTNVEKSLFSKLE